MHPREQVNKEDHLQPILATEALKTLAGEAADISDDKGEGEGEAPSADDSMHGWRNGQEPLLVSMLAEELGVPPVDILDFECSLYDVQPASISGVHGEFLCSSRLDNLASCFVATEALLEHAADADALSADTDVSLIALFDHEEVPYPPDPPLPALPPLLALPPLPAYLTRGL